MHIFILDGLPRVDNIVRAYDLHTRQNTGHFTANGSLKGIFFCEASDIPLVGVFGSSGYAEY